MSDVTRILSEIEQGDPRAAEQLLPMVYEELRRLASGKMKQESPDHTLQATALVHEAYIRLVDVDKAQNWRSRGHFLAAAAVAMRRILVDWARRKGASKRGGDRLRIDLDDVDVICRSSPQVILALDESIKELATHDSQSAQVAELRLYAGLSLDEVGKALGISRSSAHRRWLYARASLHESLTAEP